MVAHTFNVGLRKQRQGDLFEFQASQCELKFTKKIQQKKSRGLSVCMLFV